MSNDTIKVSGWIVNGAPAKYGVQLENSVVLPLKEKQFNKLHSLWHKLKEPSMWFNKQNNNIQFGIRI